jgi:cyclic beta-1,2-glucan synthetase
MRSRDKPSAHSPNSRLILAFFPLADAAAAGRAVRRAAKLRIRATLSDGRNEANRADRYSTLRLPDELLLIAEAPAATVQSVVEEIRREQPVSTFVIPTFFSSPVRVPAGAPDPSWAQEAARVVDPQENSEARLIQTKLAVLEADFEKATADLITSATLGHAPGPAASWILENGYLVQNEIEEIRRTLEGPKTKPDPRANYAQVHRLARRLLEIRDHDVTEESIYDALQQFQSIRPLTTAELWSFAQMLRVALLEELSKLASDAASAQQHREAAYLWANRLIASGQHGDEAHAAMLKVLDQEEYSHRGAFLAALVEVLQGEEEAFPALQNVADHWGQPLTESVRAENAQEASRSLAAAHAFGSLRALGRLDVRKVFERVSVVDEELRLDPSGTYAASDFETRDRCRQAVERISRWSGTSERAVAQIAVQLASEQTESCKRHVPCFLVGGSVAELERKVGARPPLRVRFVRATRTHSVSLYLSSVLLLTASLDAVALDLAHGAGVHGPFQLAILGALAFFPLSELAIQIVHALIIATFPPSKLPKMDYESGLPNDCATLVVIPMMLVSEATIRGELEKLEVRYLANPDQNLSFALFADFLDAPDRTAPGDAALLEAARSGIAALNDRHKQGNFMLFHRSREWCEGEDCWIGRERKRGKIEDLNLFLTAQGAPDILREGHLRRTIRYVITLDADTVLPPNSGRRLVETIAHPCNQVQIDPDTHVRTSGYAIIQPRVAIALPGATATRFTRAFADTSGLDPYCRSVSDIQQDYFNEGTYHGKAIYDVKAFQTILGDRFPAETLLSHDLIEGAHAGVGLATDIELLENIPLDYSSFTRRQHRWIRGDWQIAPWIGPRVPGPNGEIANPLGAISRWRIFDNLRRSLVPVASFLLLLFGWLTSVAPSVWSVVVALAIAIPALAPLLDRWARQLEGTVHGRQGASDELIRSAVLTAFLPHQAWLTVDAIVRVLYRRHFSHRHLLEWQTADAAEREAGHYVYSAQRQMLIVAAMSAALVFLLEHQGRLAPTVAFLFLWMVSPLLLSWLNRPASQERSQQLREGDLEYLSQAARLTWRFFDDLVNHDSNWLPPDNTQLALCKEVAMRTSPTNIGLWLTSALAAHDFGWITAAQFSQRATATMATIDLMERQDGHLLNWYDIQTLSPLNPRYVSSVDSGNLLASLWTIDRAIEELLDKPLLDRNCLNGLLTTLNILTDKAGDDLYLSAPCRAAARLLRVELRDHELIARLRLVYHSADPFRDVVRWQTGQGGDRAYWAARFAEEIGAWTEIVDRQLRWMETLARPTESFLLLFGRDVAHLRREALLSIPSLLEMERGIPAAKAILNRPLSPEMPPEAAAWIGQLAAETAEAEKNAADTVREMRRLQQSVRRLADGMNMRSLYDESRRHFAVGYVAGGPTTFSSHYDLLASESRLTSLVAIAKGDVPIEHWFALGRPMRTEPQGRQLLSWSGTMFEFLMPLLFTNSYENSQLDLACRNAVKGQIRFGETSGVPWGLSESAYSAIDVRQTYQYRAFGVPELAQNPDVDHRLVVSPYSTMLALSLDLRSSMANLRALESSGLKGPMGFYESIDHSRTSSREGGGGVVIYTYMAHHQGMTLAALDNLIHGDVIRRRFHSDPRIRAIESLLFERIPLARLRIKERRPMKPLAVPRPAEGSPDRAMPAATALPQTLLLGNGRYSVMVTNSGSGYSRWNTFDITRWRADAALDKWGTFVLLHEARSNVTWSATLQPVNGDRGEASAAFSADRAEFRRMLLGIETLMSVSVSADDDVEVRRLIVSNRSRRRRPIGLTSFAELALAPHAADAAHPAFGKIFVETESTEDGVIVAHRRSRSPQDAPLWVAHMIVGASGGVEFETSRRTFLGRARSIVDAAASERPLNGTVGAVLDPVASLRCHEILEPRGRLELSFVTMAAPSREELFKLIAKYRRTESAMRVLDLAWTHAQLEFRHLQITAEAAHSYQQLAGYLIFPGSPLRVSGSRPLQTIGGQRDLWALGISGDLPILTVSVREQAGMKLLREVLGAHSYWRARGFLADLVVLNQEAPSYDRPLNFQLQRLLDLYTREVGMDRPGGVFFRDWFVLTEPQRALLMSSSRAVLYGTRGALARQLPGVRELSPPALPFTPAATLAEEPSPPLPFLELAYFNGVGGFSPDGREYAIYLGPGTVTPSPWANVIATPDFGCMVTESGLGFTWRGNSQMNRLTTWQNDPVSDPASETIYLRDEDSGAIWTPTSLPIREEDAYRARHGQGYTVFEHNSHSIGQELTVFVPFEENGPHHPVKICRLRLHNHASRKRSLTVTYFAEWVLGTQREDQAPHIATSFDGESGALLARQSWSADSGDAIAFAAMHPRASSYSGDRGSFLGRNGSRANPAALKSVRLDNAVGGETDPGAALQVAVTLPVGGHADVVFLLGQASDIAKVREIAGKFRDSAAVEQGLTNVQNWWQTRLGALQVHTPNLSVDFLLNRWLVYQTLSCRFWGRSALYQSSGAFGFRDQLQDSLALLHAAPELARAHILLAASRQFSAGDVQHWWHAGSGMGVRTRCSDDLLWLPYAAARYSKVTGDTGIFDEPVPFLEGPALAEGEMEHLFTPEVSPERASLWDHCHRAIESAWRIGPQGLPLFGNGDWNDGMNLVGHEGKGESVWLAWFLLKILRIFAELADARDVPWAAHCRERAAQLAKAIDATCWDGEWYLRGFFDDGSPLGSHKNSEARIDSLPQSWAVIAGGGDPDRARIAMESADRELAKEKERIVLLFTPPFDHSTPHPGYIMGYPPGIRENGGQYTHGSLWLAMAWARLGEGGRAVRLLQMMNPIEHCRSPHDVERYKGEPYVGAADVYASPLQMGQAGWTWYTGSAAWMYRVWMDEVLGFELTGRSFTVRPALPANWDGFKLSYRHEKTTYEISVIRTTGSPRVEMDGAVQTNGAVPLLSDGAVHNVVVHVAKVGAEMKEAAGTGAKLLVSR